VIDKCFAGCHAYGASGTEAWDDEANPHGSLAAEELEPNVDRVVGVMRDGFACSATNMRRNEHIATPPATEAVMEPWQAAWPSHWLLCDPGQASDE
jgi:hypothetical protein